MVLLSLGPQHPATHGVLRLIPISHGEIIQFLSPEIGLLHRGSEKLIECNYYNSSIPYSDRSDYVSTVSQELLFVFTLERLINCYVLVYSSFWIGFDDFKYFFLIFSAFQLINGLGDGMH